MTLLVKEQDCDSFHYFFLEIKDFIDGWLWKINPIPTVKDFFSGGYTIIISVS